MSLLFYLWTFAINLWKFVTVHVTVMFVNNQHDIQRRGQDFEVCIWRATQQRLTGEFLMDSRVSLWLVLLTQDFNHELSRRSLQCRHCEVCHCLATCQLCNFFNCLLTPCVVQLFWGISSRNLFAVYPFKYKLFINILTTFFHICWISAQIELFISLGSVVTCLRWGGYALWVL